MTCPKTQTEEDKEPKLVSEGLISELVPSNGDATKGITLNDYRSTDAFGIVAVLTSLRQDTAHQ